MDDADAALAAEQQEVKNPFPTPPVYWNRYTPENLRLLVLLKDKIAERSVPSDPAEIKPSEETIDQVELLPHETLLPSFPLLELEPPRLDWILEEDQYSTFGEYHSTHETVQAFPPEVERLYNPEPGADPRPHLRQLLVSLLSSYHKLLSDTLEPVPSGYHGQPPPEIAALLEAGEATWPPPLNWESTILWMRTIVLNLGWAVNEYRPVQARMALESMMQRQIEVRREETRAINSKCDELEKVLTELRQNSLANRSPSPGNKAMVVEPTPATAQDLNNSSLTLGVSIPSIHDLIQWSKEVPL